MTSRQKKREAKTFQLLSEAMESLALEGWQPKSAEWVSGMTNGSIWCGSDFVKL